MNISRIWIGSQIPTRYKEYGQMWEELNPGHSLHDWTDEEIFDTKWDNQAVLDQMYRESKQPGADMIAYYTHVADVVDYELIYRYGGWYFNTDMKPIRSLSILGSENELWAYPALAMEDDIHPVNMAMYCRAGDAFFAKVIELLPKRYFSMPGAYMNATTGVQLLQEAVSVYTGPLTFYHRNVFNPIHWSEFDYGTTPDIDRKYDPETVAVHEWMHRTNQRGQRVLND